jgi:hypothetical protein
MLYAVRSTKSYSGLPLYFASNNIINYNNYKILVGKLHSTIDGRTTTTTTTTKKLLAMLAAGILVTGATFFAVPPQQKAFADHEGIEHDNNDEEQQADLDIEVFDSNSSSEYVSDDDDNNDTEEVIVESHDDLGRCELDCEYYINRDDNDKDDDKKGCSLDIVGTEECTRYLEDDYNNYDNPETWINWVRTLDGGKNVKDGGHINSNHFKVDFQSDATDTGDGSHVDISIDGERYFAVASPHTFTIAAGGYHTISLKGVDKYDNEDRTPAKFSFTIVNNDFDNKNKKKNNDKIDHKDIVNKVEDSEDDVIFAIEKKLNKLEDNISEEHAVQDEQLEDIEKDINKLRRGQQNLSDDVDQRLDRLEKRLLKAIDANEKALKAKIEDSENDVQRKVEDSEDDTISRIDQLQAWLARVFRAFLDLFESNKSA